MKMKTRLCELLGIEYPIIQGGMNWIANAELAAAVSQAGGLGLIVSGAGLDPAKDNDVENVRRQIRKARQLTKKPFGVNISLGLPNTEGIIKAVLEEGVRIVVTSRGSPTVYTKMLKSAGAKVMHLVACARHARRAEVEGVDAVIAEGYEAGGHDGLDELPTMVLVPSVVEAVKVPVVAAGGIVDGRGFVAALALGADGVQIGTRFIATQECIAHPNFKQAILNAIDTGTVITGRKLGPTRVLKGPVADKVLAAEARGASADELQSLFSGDSKSRLGQLLGNLENGEAYCGAGAGLVKEILPAGEAVRRIVKEAEEIVAQLARV